MLKKETEKILERQHYRLAGKNRHSAVQVCMWTKKSLKDEGNCYKQQFYGIKSHGCVQMSPAVMWCPNKCVHCWRAIELTEGDRIKGKIDSPKEIVDDCIKQQQRLLIGFKDAGKVNMTKYNEAQKPSQFAISLSGEPTIYPNIGGLIDELRKRKISSFLVTNGLYPEKIKELIKKHQLPTQLYVSVNTPNEELYKKFHRSSMKDAWKKLNQTLDLIKTLSKKKARTVVRLNLVRELNMYDEMIPDYARLIKKASPMFTEVKAFMSVGFARKRLGYDRMPYDDEILNFSKKLAKELGKGWKILDYKKESKVTLLGKNKKDMKIKKI